MNKLKPSIPERIKDCNFFIRVYEDKILMYEKQIDSIRLSIASEVTLRTSLENEMATVGVDLAK